MNIKDFKIAEEPKRNRFSKKKNILKGILCNLSWKFSEPEEY